MLASAAGSPGTRARDVGGVVAFFLWGALLVAVVCGVFFLLFRGMDALNDIIFGDSHVGAWMMGLAALAAVVLYIAGLYVGMWICIAVLVALYFIGLVGDS